MDSKELHAYILGPDFTAVAKWLDSIVTDLKRKETIDLAEEIGTTITNFDGKHETLVLEQLVDTELLELTIRTIAHDSIFAEWDNIILGETLVDDLGCMTLVDCGGLYTHPLSDSIVRISGDKMELVELPETIYEPFDEKLTQLIKTR